MSNSHYTGAVPVPAPAPLNAQSASTAQPQKNLPPEIIFIAIDLDATAGRDTNPIYLEKTGIEKVDLLAETIEQTCVDLRLKEAKGDIKKNAMWIIAWREYGVFEIDSKCDRTERFATAATKKYLKDQMSRLTSKYLKLTIIAGTIATTKIITNPAQTYINQIQANYDDVKTDTKCQDYKNFTDIISAKQNQITVVRNTCFVFQSGTIVATRCKISPYDETNEHHDWIFYPGKPNKMLIKLKHPDPNINTPITIGIEICFEHCLGVYKQMQSKAILHCILSDSVSWKKHNQHGDFVIHVDSGVVPQLRVSPKNQSYFTFRRVDVVTKIPAPIAITRSAITPSNSVFFSRKPVECLIPLSKKSNASDSIVILPKKNKSTRIKKAPKLTHFKHRLFAYHNNHCNKKSSLNKKMKSVKRLGR